MFIYFKLLFFLLLVSFISFTDKRYTKIYFLFSSIVFILFATLRIDVGPDYYSYENIFEELNTGVNRPYLGRLEPSYKYINLIIGKLGFSIHAIFLICSTIVFINYYYTFINLEINPVFGIFFFLIFLFLPNVMNLVRFGVAVSFIHLSFSLCILDKKKEGGGIRERR